MTIKKMSNCLVSINIILNFLAKKAIEDANDELTTYLTVLCRSGSFVQASEMLSEVIRAQLPNDLNKQALFVTRPWKNVSLQKERSKLLLLTLQIENTLSSKEDVIKLFEEMN